VLLSVGADDLDENVEFVVCSCFFLWFLAVYVGDYGSIAPTILNFK